MTWPWVSRRAYDVVVEERDRLRAQTEQLIDQLTRLVRTEHGLAEVPRQPRPALLRMPDALEKFIAAHDSPSVRRALRSDAHRAYARAVQGGADATTAWSPIVETYLSADRDEWLSALSEATDD